MNDDDDVASKVQSKINELEQSLKDIGKLDENAIEMFENDPNFHRDTKYDFLGETNKVIRLAETFYSKHKRIIAARDSFDRNVIDKYFENALEELDGLNDIMEKLKPVYDQIIDAGSVTEEFRKRSEKFLSDMEDAFKFIIGQCEQFVVPVPSNIPVQPTNPEAPNSDEFELEIAPVTNQVAKAKFDEYQQIAKYTNIQTPEFQTISKGINDLVGEFYNQEINATTANVRAFASIVGPSLMGKTQFAFTLARAFKLFYVNFSPRGVNQQDVYKAFDKMSFKITSIVDEDLAKLGNGKYVLNSDNLATRCVNIKLKTIGLLWYLMEDSTKYDPEKSEWFEYYLRPRTFKCKPMSIFEYLVNLKKLVGNNRGFQPPIVFIDEYNEDAANDIKLLRNLCKILALPTVHASTSAKVNNLLNVNNKDNTPSGFGENKIWVYAIRKLPPADVKAILHLLKKEYTIKDVNTERTVATRSTRTSSRNDINAMELVNFLQIKLNQRNLTSLEELFNLIENQAKTCLQGVPVFVFRALFDKLLEQKKANIFDIQTIWKHILLFLRSKLIERKPFAFQIFNPYFSLVMISKIRVISEHSRRKMNSGPLYRPVAKAETIMNTINKHFYYFGTDEEPLIMPFGYDGMHLIYKGRPFNTCSNFNLFKDDIFLCMALWSEISSESLVTVASAVCDYMFSQFNGGSNPLALKNNSSAQECMTYWALCNSSHCDLGSLISGPDFLYRFIENMQIFSGALKRADAIEYVNSNISDLDLNFSSFPKLESFLSTFQIPYLIPNSTVTVGIEKQLKGLCTFGNSERLANEEGFDINFEFLYQNAKRTGYIECKYVDAELGCAKVEEYIEKTKTKMCPFTMLVTYSLCGSLKTENYYQDINEEQPPEKKSKLGRSKEPIKRISVYSIFYEGPHMKIVPLAEPDNPQCLFLIIQTNFAVPKI